MKKIVLTYGLIAGAIVSSMFVITHPFIEDGRISLSNSMLIGYTSMVIALSLIFFAVKNYRDNMLGGSITFGKAFKLGIVITLIASLVYAIFWEFYYNLFAPDFMNLYANQYMAELAKDGASAAELEAAKIEMAEGVEMYKNPLIRFAMTIMEIFPVGLIISLLCAALLRKNSFLPNNVSA